MRSYKEISLWKNVTKKEWDDWKWQVQNRITTVDQLKEVVNLTPDEEAGVHESLKILRMAISPYFAMLMDPDDPHDPIRRSRRSRKPTSAHRTWKTRFSKKSIPPCTVSRTGTRTGSCSS
jgi:L-lysine 2,3-aminomutase